MRISIVLCTWNGERYLPPQLESLLDQDRRPDEIVVNDDVSADGTWALLQAFATRARALGIEVDLQRNPVNLGYVRNFADGLGRATGDLLFLCDQDDVWHPEKLARMEAEFVRRPGLGLLHTDARLVDADGGDLGCGLFEALEMTPEEIEAEHAGRAFEVQLRRNTVTGAAAALRRALLPGVLPVPEGWVHDEWLALALSTRAQVDCLEWASIDYRQHGGNQIGIRRRSASEKLFDPRVDKRDFMDRVASRLEHVLATQPGLGLQPAQLEELAGKAAHARFRAGLPRSAARRVPAVLREARSGRYRRFSSGLRSIASDLVDLN
ncbi:MAG TPA: glycosyltransferase [Luteimonas sp.]